MRRDWARSNAPVLTEDITEDGPVCGEGAWLASVCQRRPRSGQHLLHHQVYISVGPVAILRRDCVRAEEGRYEVNGWLRCSSAMASELLELVGHVQAITGLGLCRRRAVGEHPVEPLAVSCDQLCKRRSARVGHSADDAAARGHDLHVRRAADAQLELRGAMAGPGQVRMGVHEAGDDRAAACVEISWSTQRALQLCRYGRDATTTPSATAPRSTMPSSRMAARDAAPADPRG